MPAEARPEKIDPARSVCVLIGVSDYTELQPLRSVKESLKQLRSALTDDNLWGIPDDDEHLVEVAEPATHSKLIDPIIAAAERAEDTLLVYYAGHGQVDDHDDQLYLTLPGSVENGTFASVHSRYIREAMRDHGSARRRILLLDCCYSGRMLGDPMSATDRGVKAAMEVLKEPGGSYVEGSYVMASAARNRLSHAPNARHSTLFTGALVKTMREGIEGGPQMLTLGTLFPRVKATMRDMQPKLYQEPQSRDINGVSNIDFIRNMAVLPPPEPQPPAPPPQRRSRRGWLVAGAAGVALGLTAGLLIDRWPTSAPLYGACSDQATLLDHSDALDKVEMSNESVVGLSGIALSPDPGEKNRALTVTDTVPPHLFPLTLGTATDLDPEVEVATTLRKRGGAEFGRYEFDGEALVLEQSGKTVLVASETEPSIRRFDLATGHQSGEIPVPAQFKPGAKGGAQSGRTIESLAVSPDGRHLYAGLEAPLSLDGDNRGSGILRIQRYAGTPGSTYEPDKQYAFLAAPGLHLTELLAVGDDQLLALQRQYVEGVGNAVKVVSLSLKGARTFDPAKPLYREGADKYLHSTDLFDLQDCPAGDPGEVAAKVAQPNPLLGNVEGMALGEKWTSGEHKGRYPLYLVSDDNGSKDQITRLYSFAVELPSPH
ncbi:caspase, EACC1-associated type [Streptomyces sp. NBC_01304]|uniref:caspase, EACC1-associated type n=1 Tax=Streptomyces sp. NBC_01304 TaxID=2903818 RepID=UPI002E0FBD1D|nr:esterase-like activity of phytase family protein [Streptomyces sp. NBC_01304]